MISKYQRGETARVARSSLAAAPYNPRRIGKVAAARLRKSLKTHGLIAGQIVVNRATGHLVSGHQRLAQLDALEKSPDYELDVTMVELDDASERRLNVALNNAAMQGEFDLPALGEMIAADLEGVEAYGFDAVDMQAIWPDDARLGEVYARPVEPLTAPERDLAAIEQLKDAKREGRAKLKAAQREDYYVSVIAQSADELAELIGALGLDDDTRYISCRALLDALRLQS